jgi:predicted dehydrogenase
MAQAIKTIHVGAGISGCHWLEAVRDYPAATSVACVDAQPLQLEWVKRNFDRLRGSCYQNLKQALTHVNADAAIVSSPPSIRAADVITALEAGLAVIVEAPFAIKLADAVRILETARQSGLPVIVGHDYRYRRCQQILQKLVHADKTGTITHVSYVDRRTRPVQGNFVNHFDYAQLLDAGVHHLRTLRSIFGVNPVRIVGRCSNAPWSRYQHGSTTEAIIEMENNIHIQYYGSLTSNRSESVLWIEGKNGILRAGQQGVWWRKRGWRFFLPIRLTKIPAPERRDRPRQASVALLDQLTSAVKLKRVPQINGEDYLWTLAMMEAVMLSDRTGKLIEVADVWNSAGIAQDSHLSQAVTA